MNVKGHTKIELFDGLTGKLKEKVEDDNMFTNAIDKIVNFALRHNFVHGGGGRMNGLHNLLSDHLHLVGGLLLFDSALGNDPDEIWAPASAKLTGCGVTRVVNGDANVPLLGSYNASESTGSGLTRSWVWDFATNQANGTIATACLTDRFGGFMGYGAPTIMGTSNPYGNGYPAIMTLGNIMDGSRYGRIGDDSNLLSYNRGVTNGAFTDFCIDGENDLKYMVRFKSDTLDILSHKMTPENFDLFRNIRGIQSATIESYSANLTAANYLFFYNTHEQVLYFWGVASGSFYAQQNTTITINKFDMQTKTLTMGYDSFVINVYGNWFYNNFAVTANGTYLSKGDNGQIYKHTRGGSTGVSAITVPGANNYYGNNYVGFVLNGNLYFGVQFSASNNSGAARHLIIDLSDDSMRFSNVRYITQFPSGQYGRLVPPIDNSNLVFGTAQPMYWTLDGSYAYNLEHENSNYFNNANTFTLCNYLATKNVLSSPVVKTSDRTMKVTYTITGEELE